MTNRETPATDKWVPPEVHRMNLEVIYRYGLGTEPCSVVAKAISTHFSGVPITVLSSAEESVLTAPADGKGSNSEALFALVMLSAGPGEVLEFRIQGNKQQAELLRQTLLSLRWGEDPIFHDGQPVDESASFDSLLLRDPRREALIRNREATRKADDSRFIEIYANALSQLIPQIKEKSLSEDHLGWEKAETWVKCLEDFKIPEDPHPVVMVGIISCVTGALNALEEIVLEEKRAREARSAFLCRYIGRIATSHFDFVARLTKNLEDMMDEYDKR